MKTRHQLVGKLSNHQSDSHRSQSAFLDVTTQAVRSWAKRKLGFKHFVSETIPCSLRTSLWSKKTQNTSWLEAPKLLDSVQLGPTLQFGWATSKQTRVWLNCHKHSQNKTVTQLRKITHVLFPKGCHNKRTSSSTNEPFLRHKLRSNNHEVAKNWKQTHKR